MGEPSRDEIDLLNLAVRLIQSLKRHFILLIFTVLAGIGIGYGLWRMTPGIYESQMIVVSEVLTKAYGERVNGSINSLIEEGNAKVLSELLGLKEADALQLRHMDVSCVVETETRQRSKDIVEKKDKTFFIIKAEVTDSHILPQLQDGLTHFLHNNPFATAYVTEKTQFYQTLIGKIDEELKDMESIKLRILEGKPVSPKSQDILMIDPASLFSEIVRLNELKLEYQGNLEKTRIVQLIEGFTVFEKPSKPKRSNFLLIGFVLGCTAGIGFLFLRKLVRMAG